jgi:S-adenosylmethionine uptake transporter
VNPRAASPLIPFLVACVGIALFSLMDAAVKQIVLVIGAYNGMIWRQMAASAIGGAVFLGTRSVWPAGPAVRIAMLRGGMGAAMAFTFFWGIARVPLAEGIALSFIAPLIALYLAAVLLGETIGRQAITASLLGLAGVIVIMAGRIGEGAHDRDTMLGIGAILFSALLYAYNLILQRQQAQISTPAQIAFLQNFFALCATVPFFPWLGKPPPGDLWPLILFAAAITVTSLFLLAWAYARAEAQVLIPVEYTAFLWAALFGAIFFGEEVTLAVFAGAVLIVAGCLIAARQKPAHVETTAV